jgi:three-Cys-motif partner protein
MLGYWIIKLGKFHGKVLFFDGFAGTREYSDEKTGKLLTVGSPIIALRIADDFLQYCEQRGHEPYFDKFICIAKKDNDNFENLQSVIEKEKKKIKFKDNIDIQVIHDEFANVANELVKNIGA